MMASITHFSHRHPLALLERLPPEEAEKHICYGCRQPLSQEKHHSDVYRCEICDVFLHKTCAEVPMEIMHSRHQKHSLFLASEFSHPYLHPLCDRCVTYTRGFVYNCSLCNFNLDIQCALEKKESLIDLTKDLILYHPSHEKHQLWLQPRPSSFHCDACDVKDEDASYQCTSCYYWIHRRCAKLPSTTSHDVHAHPLSLSFSLPSQYHKFKYYCGICEERIKKKQRHWLYYCELCRFFVHIKCMEIKKPQIQVDLKGLDIDDLPRLPMRDKSVELIQRFFLKNSSHENVQQEISTVSHKHPLKCSNDEQIIEDGNEDGEQILCDGCIEPIISPPYYHCAECRYFLHLPCVALPHELQHPTHPHHPLTLTSTTKFYDEIYCHCCCKSTNGFFFCCTSEGCDFSLDVKCSALPKLVEHEAHNHPILEQRPYTSYPNCRGCSGSIWDSKVFGCHSCQFYLHLECLMLPKTVKHRFDSKHPLTLRYPPHFYHPRPFDCYYCEEEINPNNWLYHCEECDLSFHVYCINLPEGNHMNSKFGQKLQIASHPHPLKYVAAASVRSFPCHDCGTKIYSNVMECETCNFKLCLPCALKFDSMGKLEK